jgi:hypothetical protein
MFPRFDFVLLAVNQLVNHLDKLPVFGWRPKVIVRTVVGQKQPLDAGPQHTQEHTLAFRDMLTNVRVLKVQTPDGVALAYREAMKGRGSFLIVEDAA